ncbi:glycerate kinase [Shewanella baltica]|uniref:glycerate kinase n=1 Tax=Shewanella baltica TaxID=62322 RepID=UPI00217E3C7C|nr:glycerate kinase [Shewanella baltica]MCS6128162.1 glycerate kinase [Shewanella baltica]MCS6137527.1 glycerate kinase [Shewanella baltica]MCS6146403.1 glycerate kinase [Shewanella baltica]MCS6170933.1 glycerate kinase [Shewanella baltica]MCS6188130.1 glycerate kinase [Shewanella baltica]
MQYRIYILELTPCGNGVEGEVAGKCDNGAPIWFYYQGSDQQAKMRFPVNQWVTVELLGRLASVQVDIIEQAPRLPIQLNFETSGQIVDISQTPEDTIYLSHSNLAPPFDTELGKSPISLGHWVNVTGELWVTNGMN